MVDGQYTLIFYMYIIYVEKTHGVVSGSVPVWILLSPNTMQ